MIAFDVTCRFSGTVLFTAEIDCTEDAARSVKLGLAVQWARKHGASLRDADLRDANFMGADLIGADLIGADFRGASLMGADLIGADFRGASLIGADLIGADFRGASLIGADLIGADLRGASLMGADLRGALCKFGKLRGSRPIVQVGPIGSEGGALIGYHTETGCHVQRGCFFGTIDEFASAVDEKHGDNAFGKEYRALIDFLRVWAGEQEANAASQEEAA